MGLTDIQNRRHIDEVVQTFYREVRAAAELGAFFDTAISDWPAHLNRIADFWESQLFYTRSYIGNPKAVHSRLAADHTGGITPYHFGLWLRHWMQTIDTAFEGPNADKLKHVARAMGTQLMLSIHKTQKE